MFIKRKIFIEKFTNTTVSKTTAGLINSFYRPTTVWSKRSETWSVFLSPLSRSIWWHSVWMWSNMRTSMCSCVLQIGCQPWLKCGTQVIKLLAVKWWRPHDPPGHLLRGAVLLNHLNRDVLPDICLISSWVPQSWNLQLAGYTGSSCILSHSGPYRKLENNWMCMLLIKKNVTVKDPQ